jgi:hypothetical protein
MGRSRDPSTHSLPEERAGLITVSLCPAPANPAA